MAGDATYSTTKLLLHGRGANGSSVFTDNSVSPKTIAVSAGASISTAQSMFGGSSMLFNGTATGLATVPSTEDLEPGPGDCTIECFIRPTATPGVAGFIIFRPNASGYPNFSLSLRSANKIEAYFSLNNPATAPGAMLSTAAAPLNVWTHIALVKSGLTEMLFIAGIKDKTYTAASHPPTGLATTTKIGTDGVYHYSGYIAELRYKAEALYTADFTPPAAPFADGMGYVSGVVLDDTGAPCARTVRLIRRDTGAHVISTISDATTGAYSLPAPTLDEVCRIVHDDTAGTLYNDLIDRVIPA